MDRFVKATPLVLTLTLVLLVIISTGVSTPMATAHADAAGDRAALVALYNATGGANWKDNTNWLSDAPISQWHGVAAAYSDGRVIALSLVENDLNGPIPPELGNLTSLKSIDLAHNPQLTGPIPVEMSNLTNLEFLQFDDAQLTGPIPSWLGDLSNLRYLHLGNAQLTGSIQSELRNLSNLENLGLYNNQLTGPIPSWLGSFSNLERLQISNNQLTGTIPPELGNLSNLTILRLSSNQLTGSIPAELGNLTNLQKLYLSRNQLTGCVPAGLRDVPTNDFTALGLDFCDGEEPAPADPCFEVEALGALTAPVTKTGAWADDCDSEARPGSYARYYSFTLAEAGQVEMNLTSSADPYLVLRQGEGRDGTIEDSNDNVGSRNFNSSINRKLAAGTYTVEATTYFAKQTGDFTLSVRPLQETEDLGDLTRSVDRSNSAWTSNHESTQQMGSYARSYTFTLDAATHVVINLTSPEDPYLFLLDTNGAVVHENDNVTTRNLNSRIDETLPAGTYTIEATTYFPARTGTFHLSIGYFGATGG